jgi:adenylyl-sulfate kinase
MKKGTLIWFTGIIASGKSTIGAEVERRLRERGLNVENLDSDDIRANLSPDLGYTPEARDMNTKRLAFMGKILTRNGVYAIVAAVSSLRKFRDRARGMVDNFVEVYVNCPLDVCQQRDPKGMYKKAAEGKINDIAGMHQPFEEPLKPEVVLETSKDDVATCADRVMAKLEELSYIPRS